MRLRWRLILPGLGLLLFALGSYESFRMNREEHKNPRYFWWSSIRLDRDPLNSRPQAATPCKDGNVGCVEWDPGFVSVEPGLMAKLLVLSAGPAFIFGMLAAHGLGRSGIDEVSTFMVSMPLLIGAWYYFVGRFVDRWIYKRSQQI
jgi:hypothetical protein